MNGQPSPARLRRCMLRLAFIAGPIIAEDHYHVRPLERVDFDEILELIRDKRYRRGANL